MARRSYTHAARQTADGKWSSKLGKAKDIEHDSPDDVAGSIYGEVVQILERHSARSPVRFIVTFNGPRCHAFSPAIAASTARWLDRPCFWPAAGRWHGARQSV